MTGYGVLWICYVIHVHVPGPTIVGLYNDHDMMEIQRLFQEHPKAWKFEPKDTIQCQTANRGPTAKEFEDSWELDKAP